MYSIATTHFEGTDTRAVQTLHGHNVETVVENGRMSFKPVAGSEFAVPADLVLLAMGFVGPEKNGMLTDLGVTKGDRVGLYLDKSIESIIAIYAAMKCGASYVQLDPWAPAPRQHEPPRRTAPRTRSSLPASTGPAP